LAPTGTDRLNEGSAARWGLRPLPSEHRQAEGAPSAAFRECCSSPSMFLSVACPSLRFLGPPQGPHGLTKIVTHFGSSLRRSLREPCPRSSCAHRTCGQRQGDTLMTFIDEIEELLAELRECVLEILRAI
ncbi:hypothetical protein, partial [Mesorhizobium sp.]|uniref:hypothetical protein n=1 Tax=Mesorhizobium sp. TaxID=1871066 RepID=UPI0025ECFCB9